LSTRPLLHAQPNTSDDRKEQNYSADNSPRYGTDIRAAFALRHAAYDSAAGGRRDACAYTARLGGRIVYGEEVPVERIGSQRRWFEVHARTDAIVVARIGITAAPKGRLCKVAGIECLGVVAVLVVKLVPYCTAEGCSVEAGRL